MHSNDQSTGPSGQADSDVKSTDTVNRLRAWFDAAIEQPVAMRADWLATHVLDADDREAVRRLLEADDDRGFLDTPALEHAARLDPEEIKPDGLIGRQIGQFRLTRVLGQGGMATVFLGERIGSDFHQQVAIKLLRRGLYSELEQRLFLRERQLLAALEHPNIARLIDGGVTQAGIPYLVLEYINGVPITRFVEDHRLSVPQKLALFVGVCRAVEAAHRNLIVHRDIKPSNILVTESGDVKLLDFGIAKLLSDDIDPALTGTVGVFTPEYAAPEQVHGSIITTATDVYGLGVLLHEMLLGLKPTSLDARGSGPRRPSSRVSEIASRQSNRDRPVYTADQLRRLLHGDLDNIVLKALEPEPERRYSAAGAFADDIERHLAGRPVIAHPPTRWYRTRKFIQRHRGGVTVTAILVLAICAALGMALWQANVARHEAQRANSVRDFLIGLFDAAKTGLPRNQRPTPELLVAEAAKRLRTDASVNPELGADLMGTLGTVTLSMGDYAQAESLLDDAMARQRALGVYETSPQWLELLVQKGNLLQRTNRNADADRLMAGALDDLRRQNAQIAISGLMLYSETRFSAGHADEAMAIAQEVAARARQDLPPDSLDALKSEAFPGEISASARRYKETVPLLEPVVARWRQLDVPHDKDFAEALYRLGIAKERMGDRVTAEALYREGIALRRRIYDGPHDDLAAALEQLAAFLVRQERFDEAQTLLVEALAMNQKVLGPDNSSVASTLDTLGVLEATRRQFAAAEQHLAQSIAIYVQHPDAGQEQDLALSRNHLAQALVDLDRPSEAVALNSAALTTIRALHGEHDLTAGVMYVSSRIALALKDAPRALKIADEALGILSRLDVPSPRMELLNRQARARALFALHRNEEALTEINRALDVMKAALPDAHVKRAAVLALRARIEASLGKTAEQTATIAEARALNVPAELLSPEDRATLATP